MIALLFIAIALLATHPVFTAAATIATVAIVGENIAFTCNSSFPPAWVKVNPNVGEYKTLAMSGQKHPNFKDPRFSFSNWNSEHRLKIDKVKSSDVGSYVCDGDKSATFLLNVIR